MLSKSAGRVAWCIPPRPSCTAAVAAASARCVATRSSTRPPSTHQRRPSSSKASYPPGGPRSSETATEDTANAAAEDDKRPGNGRLSKRRPRDPSAAEKAAMKARDDAFANIPAVPSTNHLQVGEVHTSSFFSLHRPISVTTPIPPVDNPRLISTFDSIFKPQPPPNAHKISDVIYTISPNASENSGQSKEEKDLRWEILQQSSSNAENTNGNRRHQRALNITSRDGSAQHLSLEDIVKQCRPFHVPPAPVPFDDALEQELSQGDGQKQAVRNANEQENVRDETEDATPQKPRRRPWKRFFSTTLTVTEYTTFLGRKVYTASSTPITERSRPATSEYKVPYPKARQPFLAHLHERQSLFETFLHDRSRNENRDMWAISVKRQRKLKMKKHKYKKLMRRTRNLRRREGRN